LVVAAWWVWCVSEEEVVLFVAYVIKSNQKRINKMKKKSTRQMRKGGDGASLFASSFAPFKAAGNNRVSLPRDWGCGGGPFISCVVCARVVRCGGR
jgi:hypothetical protein